MQILKIAREFLVKYKKWIIGAVVISAALFFFLGGKKEDSGEQIVKAKKGTIEEVVNITGKVKPAKEVDLSFERGGVVRVVNVKVDDVVSPGTVLAAVSNGDSYGRLLEAQAGLDAANATLGEMKRGARQEEVRIRQTALESAKQDLSNTYLTTPDTLRNSLTNASDAVQVKLSALFEGYTGSSYKLTFTSCDSQTATDVTNLRFESDTALKNIQGMITSLNVSNQDATDETLSKLNTELKKIDLFVTKTRDYVTNSCSLADKSLDAYRTSATLAKVSMNSALSELSTKRNTVSSQKLLVQRAQNELDITLSGTDEAKIRAQEAVVKQAVARVTQAQADVSQTVIIAPFKGRITKVDTKIGQYSSPSVGLITMISDSTFEIEAKIPEVDVARVKVNNKAVVWIEAFGKDVIFDAVVTRIDPAETVTDGVSTYKAILQFTAKDERVKSGMTANIDIITSQKENTVSVPARAVQTNDNGRFVTVKVGDTTKEVIVKQGVLGKGGEREITEGLEGGEDIVIPASK